MTGSSEALTQSPSQWSTWSEATDEQRAHFKTETSHRAWSRVCGGCGEGDYLERKQKPTSDAGGLLGRGFPILPNPINEEKKKRRRFRTPADRIHTCAAPADGATKATH